jgi:hypothetical protein
MQDHTPSKTALATTYIRAAHLLLDEKPYEKTKVRIERCLYRVIPRRNQRQKKVFGRWRPCAVFETIRRALELVPLKTGG